MPQVAGMCSHWRLPVWAARSDKLRVWHRVRVMDQCVELGRCVLHAKPSRSALQHSPSPGEGTQAPPRYNQELATWQYAFGGPAEGSGTYGGEQLAVHTPPAVQHSSGH